MSNNTTINSELFAPLVAAAQFAAYEQSVARQLVTVFDAPVNAGKIIQVPVWSAISASNPGEGNVAVAANTNTTSADITLSEHVVYHRITDMLRDSAYGDVMSQLGEQSGRAIAESMDTQAFATFASLSGSTSAIGFGNVTVNDIMDRVSTLRANKLTGPFVAVIHPSAANTLKKALTATNSYTASGGVADSILTQYFVGQIAGCTIIESALVPVAAGIATCAVFAPSALGHAMRGAISLEEQRQAAFRATDLVLTGVAGAQVLQSSHGLIMNVDITA
jgi:N4-gp56 family major capsid protein